MGARDHHSDKWEAGSRNGANPTKWWQWVLVYAGIVLGMLGTIPTAIEALKSSLPLDLLRSPC